MDKQKEQYLKAIQLIKQEKYKEAIDYLDVLLLKDQKNIEYNLCSGLCFQRLGQYNKAEEFYEYTYEKKPNDVKVLNALFKLNKDDLKNKEKAIIYGEKLISIQKQTDIIKAMDTLIEYCKILHENQERKKLDHYFLELIKYGSPEQVYKIADFYIPLIIDLKIVDIQKPKTNQAVNEFSKKIMNKTPIFPILENIARKVITKIYTTETILGLAISKENYIILFEWLQLFPQSIVLLEQVLKYCHAFLGHQVKFLLEQCIILLGEEYDSMLFLNYKEYDEELYQKVMRRSQSFLAFMKTFASQIVQQCGDQFLTTIDSLIHAKNFDIIERDKDLQLFELPLKVNQLYKTGNKENQQFASNFLIEFNKKMKLLKHQDYDVSILEEIGANLGFEVLVDPVELIEMKNLLKVRIKNKAYSLETYEKYFDYQMRLISLVRIYDEELPMQLIFDKILQDQPNNLKIKIHQDWLHFSEKKINQNELISRYQSYLPAPQQLESIILKRLGTLKLMNNDLQGAQQCYEKVQGEDHEIGLALGIIAYQQQHFVESLEYLYRAFNICQNNYHLNQIIMFILTKLKQKEKAIEFAVNVYKLPNFQNIYWLSFTIGQHLMNSLQFNKAHELLQKSVDQFHFNVEKTYKLYYEKKLTNGLYSIPYFISQNDNYYLSDYPILSSDFFIQQGMIILTEEYFKQEQELKLFKLELKLSELKKILGLQGSALKSLEKAEQLFQNQSDNTISQLDEYLEQQSDDLLIQFVQQFNKIQVQSKWISTFKTKKIGLQYSKLLILLNFEAAQLYLYGQQEYFSQERFIQGILLAIYNKHDNEAQILLKSYISFTFEIAAYQLKQQLSFGIDGFKILGQKYLNIYSIIQQYLQQNVYSNECLREFFFLLGIYLNKQHLYQALQASQNVIKLLCQIELDENLNVEESFQHMRSILEGSDKKILIVKNNLQSILLCRYKLGLDCKKYLHLILSLFPKCDVFYCLAAQICNNENYIIKALDSNPKCQFALLQLGLIYIKRSNYEFAFQSLQKCIEVEPTTSSYAYLGLSIILLIYLQQNYNLELPDCNKLKQMEVIQQYQNQLSQMIASYIDYVSTLQNSPFINILSVIYRNLYMGETVRSEAILYDENSKQIITQLPIEYHQLLNCELPYVQNNDQIDKFYEKYSTFQSIQKEIELTLNEMNKFQSININYISWSQKLKYLLHLLTLIFNKGAQLKDIIQIINEIFDFLTKKLIEIKYATNCYNYDNLFMKFVENWYHYARSLYLNDISNKDYYLQVAKFQSECLKLLSLNEAQLINYIDQLKDNKISKVTLELTYKLLFMEKMHNGNWKEAFQNLQLCILHNPLNKIYRNILERLKTPFQEQHYVQCNILDLRQTNQSINWLNTIINQLIIYRADRIPIILKIIQYKILPYADQQIAQLVIKVLCDCQQYINVNNLLQQISKQYNINYEKYLLQSTIQQLLHNKDKNSMQQIQIYKSKYLDQFEDYENSKKVCLFLMPILVQLLYDRGSNLIENILEQTMQYCLYAQQFMKNDEKLKKARFIINNIRLQTYIKKLSNLEDIAETLIILKDISDEFLSQATFNPTSNSLVIHYLVVSEKYTELQNQLQITQEYLYNNDQIIIWGNIINAYNNVVQIKTVESLKNFIQITNNSQIINPQLQSLIQYLIGQAMMYVNDWQLKFSKEEVLKKFQLALLLNPCKEILKQLQPLQTKRQVKQRIKLKLESYFQDTFQIKKQRKQQTEGLNSDSDEMMVDQMDYMEDCKEFAQDHFEYIPNQQQQLDQQQQQQQQLDQQQQQDLEQIQLEQQIVAPNDGEFEYQGLLSYEQQQLQNFMQLTYEQQYEYLLQQGYTDDQIQDYLDQIYNPREQQ